MEPENKSKSRQQWIIFAILLVVGLASLSYSVFSYFQYRSSTADYLTAEGRVVSHLDRPGQDSKGSPITRFVEVVEYQVEGSVYTIVSPVEKTSPAAIGKAMDVKYDPSSPGQAVLGAVLNQTTLITGGSGIILLVVSVLVLFQNQKRAGLPKSKRT